MSVPEEESEQLPDNNSGKKDNLRLFMMVLVILAVFIACLKIFHIY